MQSVAPRMKYLAGIISTIFLLSSNLIFHPLGVSYVRLTFMVLDWRNCKKVWPYVYQYSFLFFAFWLQIARVVGIFNLLIGFKCTTCNLRNSHWIPVCCKHLDTVQGLRTVTSQLVTEQKDYDHCLSAKFHPTMHFLSYPLFLRGLGYLLRMAPIGRNITFLLHFKREQL